MILLLFGTAPAVPERLPPAGCLASLESSEVRMAARKTRVSIIPSY